MILTPYGYPDKDYTTDSVTAMEYPHRYVYCSHHAATHARFRCHSWNTHTAT